MRLEVHVLQHFAPSNLNRDDTGSPKEAEFGGYRRARVSSQCIKRSVRDYFKTNGLIPPENRAIRTKRLLEQVRGRLSKPGREADVIDRAVSAALAAGGLKVDDQNLTQYLLFLGAGEIEKLVAVVDRYFAALAGVCGAGSSDGGKKKGGRREKAEAKESAPEEVRKALPALLDGGKAVDLALFGRMLADLPERNVDAACQVAHAISTNKLDSTEVDFFTAVDDMGTDGQGAGMIGAVEFNSACFYRYASLDVGQLTGNLLGDTALAKTGAAAFVEAFVNAVPSGKQAAFAAYNPPSLVFAAVRTGGPVSLANAFVTPVHPRGGRSLVERSIEALDEFYGRLIRMHGDGGLVASAVSKCEKVSLSNLRVDEDSVHQLIDAVVRAAFPQGAVP